MNKDFTIIYLLLWNPLDGEKYIPIHKSLRNMFPKSRHFELPEHGVTLEDRGKDIIVNCDELGTRCLEIGYLSEYGHVRKMKAGL